MSKMNRKIFTFSFSSVRERHDMQDWKPHFSNIYTFEQVFCRVMNNLTRSWSDKRWNYWPHGYCPSVLRNTKSKVEGKDPWPLLHTLTIWIILCKNPLSRTADEFAASRFPSATKLQLISSRLNEPAFEGVRWLKMNVASFARKTLFVPGGSNNNLART